MTIPVPGETVRKPTSFAEALPGPLTDERAKVERAKAMSWSALAVVAIMAALLACLAVVPLAVLIFTAAF